MDSDQLRQACQHAREAVLDTWSAICHFHGGSYEIEHKIDGPSTEADKLADHLLVAALRRHYPVKDFGYLSEEFERDPIRLERQSVWIIDPIDGTSDFIRGEGDFAIQVGLVTERDGQWGPAVGVVYHPIAGRLYCAVRGQGSWMEREVDADQPLLRRWWSRTAAEAPRSITLARFHPPERLQVRFTEAIPGMVAVVSASHKTRRLRHVLEVVLFHGHYSRGSVGVKIAEIAQGHADVYVNTERSKCKEWDLCGPHLILSEAGGTVTDLDGQPITYNHEDVWLHGGILASNGTSHQHLVELISPLTVAG